MGMKLDLLGLFGGAVKELPFEITMDADGLSPDIIGGSITAKGEARNRAGYVVITAETVLDAKAVCARCGGVFDTRISFDTENKITDKLENGDDDEFIIAENSSLDLERFIREGIILDLPQKLLCGADCKGLCFKCGTNLNQSECSCDRRDIDPRLAVLSEFFDDK